MSVRELGQPRRCLGRSPSETAAAGRGGAGCQRSTRRTSSPVAEVVSTSTPVPPSTPSPAGASTHVVPVRAAVDVVTPHRCVDVVLPLVPGDAVRALAPADPEAPSTLDDVVTASARRSCRCRRARGDVITTEDLVSGGPLDGDPQQPSGGPVRSPPALAVAVGATKAVATTRDGRADPALDREWSCQFCLSFAADHAVGPSDGCWWSTVPPGVVRVASARRADRASGGPRGLPARGAAPEWGGRRAMARVASAPPLVGAPGFAVPAGAGQRPDQCRWACSSYGSAASSRPGGSRLPRRGPHGCGQCSEVAHGRRPGSRVLLAQRRRPTPRTARPQRPAR